MRKLILIVLLIAIYGLAGWHFWSVWRFHAAVTKQGAARQQARNEEAEAFDRLYGKINVDYLAPGVQVDGLNVTMDFRDGKEVPVYATEMYTCRTGPNAVPSINPMVSVRKIPLERYVNPSSKTRQDLYAIDAAALRDHFYFSWQMDGFEFSITKTISCDINREDLVRMALSVH